MRNGSVRGSSKAMPGRLVRYITCGGGGEEGFPDVGLSSLGASC